MFAKRFFAIVAAILTAVCTASVCFADTQTAFMQACINEQTADIFISGDFNISDLSCAVSNKTTEISQAGSLADMGVTIRTTYLVDCSVSIPAEMRDAVKSFLQSAIKNISKNEQFKIVLFGKEQSVAQDFTSDRYDLAAAVETIEFNAKQSRIYDSIYNTIPDFEPIDNDKPCFYRTVVITDGADVTAGGITKEELFLKLQQETYPIDVVAVSKKAQSEPAKELAALTRISGGTYINLHSDADQTQLYKSLDIGDIIWLRAAVPSELLDGSTRQFDISDGTKSLQFDYKVPVYDAPEISTTISVTTDNETEDPVATTSAQNNANANVTVNIGNFLGEHTLFILVGIIAAIIIIAAAVVIICITVGKKKPSSNNNRDNNRSVRTRNEQSNSDNDRTVFITDDSASAAQLQISIKNVNDPDQNWSLNLTNSITIGRDKGCEIFINESSISRRQCKLYTENNIPMIANISQTNITSLNGKKLEAPAILKADDIIKCGRVTLKIIAIYDNFGSYSNHSSSFNDSGTMIQNV